MKKLDAKSLDSVAGGCCLPACPPPYPPAGPLPAAGLHLLQRQVPRLLRR